MRKLFIALALCVPVLMSAQTLSVQMLPGEKWWGGIDNPDSWELKLQDDYAFPFDETTSITIDLRETSYSNNAVPFLVSTKGRYIWSDNAFMIKLEKGLMTFEGSAPIELVNAGTTLREAYLAASSAHFPPKGQLPPEEFITRPQYNTWIELMYNQNQDDILRYAHAIKDNGFPTGAVLMIDDNWQKYYGNYDFKPERFPDPKAMMDELHSMGYRVMLWVCPFVSPDSPEYRELAKLGYFVKDVVKDKPAIIEWWNGCSAMLDMSNPDARAWMVSKLRQMQEKYGVDGFKFDAGDARNYQAENIRVFDNKSYGPEHTRLWCKLADDFPYNELRASWKLAGEPIVMRLCDKRADWMTVRNLVPSMVASGIQGHIFVCPDMIGGGEWTSFLNVKPEDIDQELIVRSCQVHALMPMMQFSVAPWRILSKENMEICRAAAWRHVELATYLLEQSQKGAQTGEPVVRIMEYEFPNEGFESCVDQYMLGDRYLVAPMLDPGTRRQVKLPKGRWMDENGLKFKGGKSYDIDVPLDRIPVFTKIK